MTNQVRPRGRPGRHAKYEEFERSLPKLMAKRPAYCDGIGIFNGQRGSTAWVKIYLPKGGQYKGRSVPPGGAREIKLGRTASWSWAELERERDRLQALADKGQPLEARQPVSFADYAENWLERKKNTAKGYATLHSNVHGHLIPAFGKKRLDTISVSDINIWIGKQRAGLKPATVKRQLSTFNAILNGAVKAGEIDQNPAQHADRIKGVHGRDRFVTQEEMQAIIGAAERIESRSKDLAEQRPQEIRGWLGEFVLWAYHSGMRRSEILGLTFRNIRELEDGHSSVEVLNTKNERNRFVTCTPEMLLIIEKLRELPRSDDDDRLFPISLSTLKRKLSQLWAEAGIDDVRLHDLRRAHATELLSRGVDALTVASRLGHRGTAMLAQHYAVDRGDQKAADAFVQVAACA